MYKKIIRNDMVKNKWITLITIVFVAIATMLISLASILTLNLYGSLETMMTKAKTPHFMQMHAGEIDRARLNQFAEQNQNVVDYQVVDFLNIDGSQFIFSKTTLENSVQDNGVSVQNEKFDLLFDIEGNLIQAADGEVYVPVTYLKDHSTTIGDKLIISGKEFTVANFVRDSIMNASLSSSKRFIVSHNDYAELKKHGHVEYLIEFRLNDLATLGTFETTYTNAGLEMNGPTVTYPLFKLMNAISDGMMIAVVFILALLVVAIALMCIRFTLLAKIEDDYREIGVMKAIGLRVSDIKKIYLAKYAAIAAIGSFLGFALSFVFKNKLIENIRLYMGESDNSVYSFMLAIIGIAIVFLIIIAYVNKVLNRFKKVSGAEAIRFGASQDKLVGGNRFTLSRNRWFSTNIFLGIKDVLSRKRLYATMLSVLVICTFIMIVPQNLYNSISSKSFINYMGIGNYDLRIQLSGNVDDFAKKVDEMVDTLSQDSSVLKFTILTTKTFKAKLKDGSEENIKVELGDHSLFPIAYVKGKAPVLVDEIALSTLYADEMSIEVGQNLKLLVDNREMNLKVSGIYSDITNGGKTAKAVFKDDSANSMWSIASVQLTDKDDLQSKVDQYTSTFHYAKISPIDEFVKQTFGSTLDSVKIASYAALAVALAIAILITIMFLKMLVLKDRHSIAVMKALGFTHVDIKVQYMSRVVFVLLIAIVVGTLLANSLGELIASMVISSFGASTFEFTVNPLLAYLLSPMLLIIVVLIATLLGISNVNQVKLSEHIKG